MSQLRFVSWALVLSASIPVAPAGSGTLRVIERLPGAQSKAIEYHLSQAGRDKPVVEAFGAWGVLLASGEPSPEELDPGLRSWEDSSADRPRLLPHRRTVVEFDFTGPVGRRV